MLSSEGRGKGSVVGHVLHVWLLPPVCVCHCPSADVSLKAVQVYETEGLLP